ncbi:MAG: hypothetical protein QM706_06095 [Nitrospira sp.]
MKHGAWTIEWLAKMPFAAQPVVRVRVIDTASVRAHSRDPTDGRRDRTIYSIRSGDNGTTAKSIQKSENVLARFGLRGTVDNLPKGVWQPPS